MVFPTAAECIPANRNSVPKPVGTTVPNPMANRSRAAANDLSDTPPLSAVDSDDGSDQADDPVDAVMGGGFDELGDVDPFADSVEADQGVLPPEFDVLHVKPHVIARLREKDRDPRVTKVGIHPVIRGKRQPASKKLRPEGVTFARLRENLGPGVYDVMVYNEDSIFMGCRRIRIETRGDFDELDDLDDFASADGRGRRSRPRGGSMGDRLMYELAMRGLRGGEHAGRGSEMAEAIGSMAKMMTLNMQAQTMEASSRMKQLELEHKVSRSDSNSQLSTLKTILEVIDKRTPKRSGAGGAKVEDFVGMLQMGMHFQKMMQDGKTDISDSEEMRKWVLPIVDSVGPQLIGLAAMFLPTDKAQILTELLEQHMKTQEARANAAGDEKDTFETTAEEVKK